MYGWLWRLLPGDVLSKLIWATLIVLAVAVVLWFWVFPWVEPQIHYDHGTVGNG